jgi:ribosome-binding factor A
MDSSRKEQALEGLKSAAGFLRHEMKKELSLKTVPTLLFAYDESFDYGDKIDKLLEKIGKNEDPDS